MFENTISNFLTSIGVSENSSKIYNVLLNHGEASINTIAKLSQLNRSTSYSYIEELIKNNLAYKKIQSGKTIVGPIELNKFLVNYNDKLNQEFIDKSNQLKHLQEISRFYHSKKYKLKEPEIRVYNGENSLQKIYEESLEEKKIRCYFSYPDIQEDKVIDKWHSKKIKEKGIKCFLIMPNSNKKALHNKNNLEDRVRYFDDDRFPFNGALIISETKILMYSRNDKTGLSIYCPYLASNQIHLFDMLWEYLKEN